MNNLERAVVAVYPELQRLIDLRRRGGWAFHPVLVDGEVELLAGVRIWPLGWSDAIAIRNTRDAKAFRCDPSGGEVWGREGSLIEVIDGLIELPAPGEPGAPVFVRARRPKLWTSEETS